MEKLIKSCFFLLAIVATINIQAQVVDTCSYVYVQYPPYIKEFCSETLEQVIHQVEHVEHQVEDIQIQLDTLEDHWDKIEEYLRREDARFHQNPE